jgi:zinc transporter 9
MSRITSIGTGLLIGTALIVIIPEGIATMYSAAALAGKRKVLKSSFSMASEEGHAGKKGALGELANHGVGPQQQQNEQAGREEELAHLISRALIGGAEALVRRASKEEKGHKHEHKHKAESSHAWIGVALILGFVLMYLIDAMQKPSPSSRGEHIPLTQLDPEEAPDIKPTPAPTTYSSSTTIGLVIHSFADGIALGASSADTQTESTLGLIVFIAILVHKAPAAFGLTSVLLKQGLSKRAARAHLLLFSLAAPVGALATWTLVTLLSGSSEVGVATGNSMWWTGIALVFSGGTFL